MHLNGRGSCRLAMNYLSHSRKHEQLFTTVQKCLNPSVGFHIPKKCNSADVEDEYVTEISFNSDNIIINGIYDAISMLNINSSACCLSINVI